MSNAVIGFCLLLVALLGGTAATAAPSQLPDWSGVWVPDIDNQVAQITSNPPPWLPVVAKQVAMLAAAEKAGNPRGLFVDCLPEGMPSWMLISHNALEILVTPLRTTMLGESDGNRLRRIYTDGRTHPADPDPSFHGHSIGHWHDGTLTIDTIGVLPQAYLAVSEAVGIPNDGDLHVVEDLHLVDANTLHDDLDIEAPHILSRRWRTTRVFTRLRGARNDIVEGVCLQGSYIDGKDANGHAAFVPAPQINGNPAAVK